MIPSSLRSDRPSRPRAVDAAFLGALAGAGLAGVLVLISDRPTWLCRLAMVAAAVVVAVVVPMRAGHRWARIVVVVMALLGVLGAPAAANSAAAPLDVVLAAVLVGVWACVLGLLARLDVREYFGEPT